MDEESFITSRFTGLISFMKLANETSQRAERTMTRRPENLRVCFLRVRTIGFLMWTAIRYALNYYVMLPNHIISKNVQIPCF